MGLSPLNVPIAQMEKDGTITCAMELAQKACFCKKKIAPLAMNLALKNAPE